VNRSIPQVLDDEDLRYVYGVGRNAQVGASTHYYLSDGLGSTINLCDASGAVLVTYAYDVFGAIRSQSDFSANYHLFTGEQRDAESGFDFLRARYYDPAVGRFLSGDALGGGYVYGLNNPANMADPTGLIATFYCNAYGETPDVNVGIQDKGLDEVHPKVGVGVGTPGYNFANEVYPNQNITVGDYCGSDISGGSFVGGQYAQGQSFTDDFDPEEGLVTKETHYRGAGIYAGTPGIMASCGSVFGDISPLP
jgi:RHS repeat-associated protein